jgi:hypothetical protein
LIGRPESDPAIILDLTFNVAGEPVTIQRPLIYKWNDPVKGEQARPFEIVPPLFVGFADKVVVFHERDPREVTVTISSSSDHEQKGVVKLSLPPGWKASPQEIPFTLAKNGQSTDVKFNITAGDAKGAFEAGVIAEVDGKSFNQSADVIEYSHIPTQTLLAKAKLNLLRIDLKKEGGVVGYIRGAGDDVPSSLRNMGYEVWEMKDEEVTPANLKKVDAVVLGVRALNTNDKVKNFMPHLFEFAKEGGAVIVQYNTNQGLEIDPQMIAPYSLSLSRDRVTEENSEVKILKPDNIALNHPNKITDEDFKGWVQERGLYFPDKWDAQFDALLSMHDAGEPARDGGLLVAKYGEGYYVYTGLSFFRELPEGVPGSYRLFANLVSLGKMRKMENVKLKAKAK